ncbi:nucleotidyltransferase domain-containing protein [candidate division KSB1 bacterium]|nr:nucleotidyltransferase domain-containing protein [candidate division KSB1 bacterium]MBL7095020.1 nucleotidyltransferase domain-containing protein [candidate division KSB1 bacterium]
MSIVEQKTGHLISDETIKSIVQSIAEHFSPEKILIFGSYASRNASPDSDLDIMVVMETDLPRHKRATPIRLSFKPTPCAMDILVYTPKEVEYWNGTPNHIISEIFQSGMIVYEQ